MYDTEPAPLQRRIPARGDSRLDRDEALERFLEYVIELGFELFPAQEEALLELYSDKHLILSTPTGSGKSLVAAGLHFKAMVEGRRSYYTSPIKALASEKFFELCDSFGADNVGMLTGDASINADAPIICCTAEVLSNLAIRRGPALDVDAVIMDEFHYYADPERGVAWQIPLIALPDTTFLLMSATLGNPAPIQERLQERTGRDCAVVTGVERPVPLEYEYRETPIHETVQDLCDMGRSPLYVVNFTQRECAELAGALTSLKLAEREEKDAIWDEIGDFRFDTAYGKEMKRFLGFGLAVHHAGLLPKYRLLVERLAQKGLLKVICGTDTLGVGVNVPIRTVLFRKLCKYDGEKVDILKVRDFRQISGRAGRKGYDDRGYVVCQAPEHVIENLRIDDKIRENPKKAKKLKKKTPPDRGYVHWDEDVFRRLIEAPTETLESRFRVDHGLLLQSVQRDIEENDPNARNFATLRELIAHCHETPERKAELVGEAAQLAWSLAKAGILRMVPDSLAQDTGRTSRYWVDLAADLQIDFALHHALSLYLVESITGLEPESPDYTLDLLSFVEAILENPDLILRRQLDKIKDELVAQMKAEGVEYDERMAKLEETTWPKPNEELIYATFNAFRERQPWVQGHTVKPKGIGREIWSEYLSFEDFVRRYGIQRSEGLLLRYLSQMFKVLSQNVPDEAKTEGVWDLLGFLRTMLTRVDSSLLQEWENMLHPDSGLSRRAGTAAGDEALEQYELLRSPRAFRARVRAELHQLVRALSQRDWEEAVLAVWQPVHPVGVAGDFDEQHLWTSDRFEEALQPFFDEYDELHFGPLARQAHWTRIEDVGPGHWRVRHTLLDEREDNFWHVDADVHIDTNATSANAVELGLDRPILRLRRLDSEG